MVRIYEPKGRAREYSPFALNYFKGCDHGCKYCYVPNLMKVFNSSYVHEDVSCSVEGMYREAERFRRSRDGNKQVLLSFTGDPYCGYENGETRKVLSALLDNQIHVSVLTKNPEKAIKDIDIMSEFEFFKIGTTLTCYEDDHSLLWERGAPTGKNRIQGLREFAERGIKTWVSFEPVIYPEETLNMIEIVSKFADHVKIGKINNHPREKDVNWKEFVDKAVLICRDKKLKFYVKDDLAKFSSVTLLKNERDKDYLNV